MAQIQNLVAQVALVMLLAGCTEPGRAHASGPGLADPELPDAYGTIQGYVLDDELLAVPGVLVQLEEGGRFAYSDKEGYFRLLYVAVGPYTVVARQEGSEPVAQSLLLGNGETLTLTFVVSFPPIDRAYHATMIETGYFGCNAVGDECPVYSGTPSKHVFPLSPTPDTVALLLETVWRPTVLHPELSRLHGWVYFKDEALPRINDHRPPPYLRLYLDAPTLRNATIEAGLRLDVRSEFLGINDRNPGIAYEQPFTVHVTYFHKEDHAEGFSALPVE